MPEQELYIRNLYHPSQPAGKSLAKNVSYQEYKSDPRLRHLIHCYWHLKSDRALGSPFLYRVVSDGCTDIFFNQHNPEESFFQGFNPTYSLIPLGGSFAYFGIRFYPASITRLFGMDASDPGHDEIALSSILPDLARHIAKLSDKRPSASSVSEFLNQYFIRLCYKNTSTTDPRFLTALELILNQEGDVTLKEDLDTGLSQRQLRRLFSYYIGGGPKLFSRIIRFQHFIYRNLILTPDRLPAHYNHSYYDQAHLIKDFRSFYGSTPSEVKSDNFDRFLQ